MTRTLPRFHRHEGGAIFDSAYATLHDQTPSPGYFTHPDWFANLAATCLSADETAVIYTADDADGAALAALPCRRRTASDLFPGARSIRSLTNFYACGYLPLVSPDADLETVCPALIAAMTSDISTPDILDLNSLPREAPSFDALLRAIQARGWLSRPYFHFGNWFEDVAGLDYDGYLARRPSRLRNTILRKQKQLRTRHDVRFDICHAPETVEAALADYQTVYADSWKTPEPFPQFTPGLVRHAAARGVLRLGVCHLDGAPAAAQIWLTHGGHATIFKLAYVERHRQHSLGTLLTAHMMRHALEADRVTQVDFGRGDDAYKQDWLARRRERWGILAFNPRRIRGLGAAARHLLAPALRDLLRRPRR